MTFFWIGAGVLLAGMYGWIWVAMFVASDADDDSIAEWERQQAVWRGDNR